MKKRYLIAGVLLWMVLAVVILQSCSGEGGREDDGNVIAEPGSPGPDSGPIPDKDNDGPFPPEETPPDNDGPFPPEETPPDNDEDPYLEPAPGVEIDQASDQQVLAASGWALLSKLPYERDGVTVTYVAAIEDYVVLNVTYSRRIEQAIRVYTALLEESGDEVGFYRVRWISPEEQQESATAAEIMELALDGYGLLPSLPWTSGQTTVRYGGWEGEGTKPTLIVTYQGERADAEAALNELARIEEDELVNYTVRWRRDTAELDD